MTDPLPIIRESQLVQSICRGYALLAIIFAAFTGLLGHKLTSKQWQYLMEVPGGRWTWALLFGLSGAIAGAGLLTLRYGIGAVGLLGIGFGSALIATFYLMAPLIDPGLLTLGWWPWMICALLAAVAAVVNWRPITWF